MNLADPDLELIDPTPNVHSMFLHFDKTFFWTKLASRAVVRWSKRMYSCAGICSYEGRGGLCDIALSEPLLKLRPRKDLVETLLHEMIHAYLFITCRDQDRDGHGPNFQAHMHRINRAAGLNISIYHDFHDEVKLYQTHWWRCNGPCQKMRPYFGIVRRTNNRAPGPSDYWWKDHMRKCGGTYIKIKEPEKTQKAGKKTKVSKTNGDITKYVNNNNDKEVPNKNFVKNDTPAPILIDSSDIFKKSNVTIKSNSSSTIVVTKKNVLFNPQVPKPVTVFNGRGQTISADGKRTDSENVLETVRNVWANKQLGANTNKNKESVKSKNHSNIFSNPSKHKANDPHTDSPPMKIKKIDDYFRSTASSVLKNLYGQDFNVTESKKDNKLIAIPKKEDLVDCPICKSKCMSSEINNHLDECLNKDVIEKITKDNIKVHKQSDNTSTSDKAKLKEIVGTLPPVPNFTNNFKTVKDITNNITNNNRIKQEIINDIINLCDTAYTEGAVNIKINRPRMSLDPNNTDTAKYKDNKANLNKLRKSDSFKEPKVEKDTKPIFAGGSKVRVQPIKVEPGCSKDGETPRDTECPCCSIKINTSIDEHLDECLSFFDNNSTIPEEGASTSFGNETIVIDDDEDDKFDESQTLNATGTKSPCPCCLQMVEEIDMNSHLDKCLS